MLPSQRYQNNYWPVPSTPGQDYLLAHQSVSNSIQGTPGYTLYSNIYLRTRTNDLGAPEQVYSRELNQQYINLLTPKFRVREQADSTLSGLLEYSNTNITYVQQAPPLDTPTDRAAILATGLYQNKSAYALWAAADYWYRADSLNYRYNTVAYTGEPLAWELALVLAEQARRAPRTGRAGTQVPAPIRQTHTDFRPYRPLALDHPEQLDDALVQAVSADQTTVESVAQGLLTKLLQPDQITQAAYSSSYQTHTYPLTDAQVIADQQAPFEVLADQIAANPSAYIQLLGYPS